MVESTTLNYHWTKPEITKSPSTWGKFLNDDLDAIDGLVFANQQAIVPIGAMTMYGGATAPTNWLICDGRTLDYGTTPAYQALFNIIGRVFNPALTGTQFALPNLTHSFPLGANPGNPVGQTGGAFSYTLSVTNLPAHSHPITDPTHKHSITDVAHNHSVNAIADHIHGDAGHGHANSTITVNAHTHQLPGGFGYGIGGIAPGPLVPSGYGVQATTGGASASGGTANIAAGFASLGGASPPVTVSLAASGSNLSTTNNNSIGITSTGNTGSAAPLSVIPVFVAVNFIIRYQ